MIASSADRFSGRCGLKRILNIFDTPVHTIRLIVLASDEQQNVADEGHGHGMFVFLIVGIQDVNNVMKVVVSQGISNLQCPSNWRQCAFIDSGKTSQGMWSREP